MDTKIDLIDRGFLNRIEPYLNAKNVIEQLHAMNALSHRDQQLIAGLSSMVRKRNQFDLQEHLQNLRPELIVQDYVKYVLKCMNLNL